MFRDVSKLPKGQPVEVCGYGHTELDDPGVNKVSQADFILHYLSEEARSKLLQGTNLEEVLGKWDAKVGIRNRLFFAGNVAELAVLAARKCLEHAGVKAEQLDYIVAGTNTGPGYPSLADQIKLGLGAHSEAGASDTNEACSVGGKALFEGWNYVRSGCAKYVLVVVAEKATELSSKPGGPISYDNYMASNLFCDRANALLLRVGLEESFVFWDLHSDPFDGKADLVRKTADGFEQDGNAVIKWVKSDVVPHLVEAWAKLDRSPAEIDILAPHQPSPRVFSVFETMIRRLWPNFQGLILNEMAETGNPSGAATGCLISAGVHSGQIESGQLVVGCSYGSGLSWANWGFYVTVT